MRHYPIWHEVTACLYSSSKSYGGKDDSLDTIRVGSSKSNSHILGKVRTTRKEIDNTIEFRLYVDDHLIKSMVFDNNNGKAGDKLTELNHLTDLV